MSRAKKIFSGFMIGVVVVIFATVSEMDYRDELEYEQYVMEMNARKMWADSYPEDMKPAMSASPAFIGKPSKKFFEGEYEKLRASYEEKRRRRWEAR